MPKRRILWFPTRGIDKTEPKYGESTSALSRVDLVDYAYAASELSVYNRKEIVTRRDLKAVNSTSYGTIYAICKYNRGIAVAGSSGIYLGSTRKKSTTISSVAYLAPWYNSLYYSTGSAMGYIASDDTDYELGIAAPSSWEGDTAQFTEYYTRDATNGSWSLGGGGAGTDGRLTGTGFTSAMGGEYIQVYNHTEATCFTGVVIYVDATHVDIVVDATETAPATDASGTIAYRISPHRWMTYTTFLSTGGYVSSGDVYPLAIYYKQRFKRSGDGARSNTVDYPVPIIIDALVGGVEVGSIDTSSDDTNVDQVEIFRLDTSATTSNLYRLIGTVDIGTTTFDDEDTMTTSMEALDDDNKYPCPYTLSNLCFYSNRLWGTYANCVYYSEAYITEARFGYFGPIGENYFEFPDTVKAIVPDQRRIIVFLERETWILDGLDPDSMAKRTMNEDIGTYSSTSAERFGGIIYTVTDDFKFYAIDGAAWKEVPTITSVLSTAPSYYEVRGSDNNLWISDGSQTHKIDLSNNDIWTYAVGGRLGTGSHTTYLGRSGYLYELDAIGGSESTPSSYLESPEIYIGDASGRRGMLNRLFFRSQVDVATVSVYIDGVLWKSMTVNAPEEDNVILHFYPARGYYAKVRIDVPQYNEFLLTSRIILNPW